MTLTFPNSAVFEGEEVDDVELRNPQLGDVATAANTAKRNRSMNGTQWITKRTLNYTARWNFTAIHRMDVKRFENLLRLNRGEDIVVAGFTGVTKIKILENFSSTDDSQGRWKVFPVPPPESTDPRCKDNVMASFSLTVEVIE